MREESHLDDMRSAIRGDFERLAERRGGQELLSVADEAAEPVEPVEQEAVQDELDASGEALEEPAEPPRSWLDRLLGR
jgi:hypothetical protein